MLRSSKFKWLRNLLWLAAGAAAIVVGSIYVQVLIKVDPFKALRDLDTKPLGEHVAIRLEDVKMRQFDGKKLVAMADIDRIDVKDSRQEMSFVGINNGTYY